MMKNRLIALVVLLLVGVAQLSAERFCAVSNEGRKIYYATLSDTECEVISDYTGQTTFAGDVVIPDTVTHDGKEYAVVSIGQEAFWYCRRLLRVTLPATLRRIDVSAFDNCSQLFDLKLPEGLETIGQKAFKACSNLQTIGLPSTLRTVDRQAFCDCKMLNNVHLPASVTEVGEDAFKGCDRLTTASYGSLESLLGMKFGNENSQLTTFTGGRLLIAGEEVTEVVVPEGMTKVEAYTFYNAKNLTSVVLPSTLASIGKYAFSGCLKLQSLVLPEGITTLGDYALKDCVTLKELTLPESVTTLGNRAFQACRQLKTMVIPEGVTSLGSYLLSGCDSLCSATLPQHLTAIPTGTFYGCKSLRHFTLPQGVTDIGGWAFASCASLEEIEFPDGLRTVGEWAFYGCSSLKSVSFPDNVNVLSRNMFEKCTQLQEVNFPKWLTEIGVEAFGRCSALTEVTIPACTGKIGNSAFFSCGLTKVTLLGRTRIEKEAFYYCDHLTTVHMASAEPPSIDYDAFYADTYYGNHTIRLTLEVPVGALAVYKGTSPWCDFKWIREYDVEQDIQEVEASSLQIRAAEGCVVIEGASEANQAFFFTLLGQRLGVANLVDGCATFEANVPVVIVKVGNVSRVVSL